MIDCDSIASTGQTCQTVDQAHAEKNSIKNCPSVNGLGSALVQFTIPTFHSSHLCPDTRTFAHFLPRHITSSMMSSGYNLKDPHSPIVSGRSLAFLCNVVEQVGELSGITHYLCKDAGLHVLRDTEYDEQLTTTPVWAPTQEMVAASIPDLTTSLSPADYLATIKQQADKEIDSPTLKASGGHNKFLSCRDYYVAYKSKKTTPTLVTPIEHHLFTRNSQRVGTETKKARCFTCFA